MDEIVHCQWLEGGVVIAAAPIAGEPEHWHVLLVMPSDAHYLLGQAKIHDRIGARIYTGRRIPNLGVAVRDYERQVNR